MYVVTEYGMANRKALREVTVVTERPGGIRLSLVSANSWRDAPRH